MSGGMRLDSYASSIGKDAIQYSRASSDMLLSGPMVLERRTVVVKNWFCLNEYWVWIFFLTELVQYEPPCINGQAGRSGLQ